MYEITLPNGEKRTMYVQDGPLEGGLNEYIVDGAIVLQHGFNKGTDAFACSTSILLKDGRLRTMRRPDDRQELLLSFIKLL